jgi:hypothetical protein
MLKNEVVIALFCFRQEINFKKDDFFARSAEYKNFNNPAFY